MGSDTNFRWIVSELNSRTQLVSVKNWRIAWYGKNSHKLGGQKHSVGRVERVKEETEDFLLVDISVQRN